MNRRFSLALLLLAALMLAAPGSLRAQTVGQDAKDAGHDTAHASKTVAHKTAHGTKKVYHKTAHGTRVAGHDTKVGAQKVGHGTKVAAKDTAHGTENLGDKIAGKPPIH